MTQWSAVYTCSIETVPRLNPVEPLLKSHDTSKGSGNTRTNHADDLLSRSTGLRSRSTRGTLACTSTARSSAGGSSIRSKDSLINQRIHTDVVGVVVSPDIGWKRAVPVRSRSESLESRKLSHTAGDGVAGCCDEGSERGVG
jgi:hypothetical protein